MKSFYSVAVVKCTTSLSPSPSIISLSRTLFFSLSHPIFAAKVQFATSTRRTQNWADSRLSPRAESWKNAVKSLTPFPINEHLSIKGAMWPSHAHSSLLVNSCCWTKPPWLDLSLGCLYIHEKHGIVSEYHSLNLVQKITFVICKQMLHGWNSNVPALSVVVLFRHQQWVLLMDTFIYASTWP